jgi:nicotinate-nucleotide adenylyltransferase
MPLRVGVFGGTFNPVHIGHLVVAEEARETLRLDFVLFVPAGDPPHKSPRGLAPAKARLEMVRRAVAGHPAFSVSDVEVRRRGRSYTVDTLEALHSALPRRSRLFLIVGEDAAVDLPGWREPRRILELADLVVASRDGASPRAIERLRPLLRRGRSPVVVPVRIGVSASDVRARLSRGRSARFLVPAPVLAFIGRRRLYGAGR